MHLHCIGTLKLITIHLVQGNTTQRIIPSLSIKIDNQEVLVNSIIIIHNIPLNPPIQAILDYFNLKDLSTEPVNHHGICIDNDSLYIGLSTRFLFLKSPTLTTTFWTHWIMGTLIWDLFLIQQ